MYQRDGLGSPVNKPGNPSFGPSDKQDDSKKKPRTVKQLTRTMTDFLSENQRESKGYGSFILTVLGVYYFLSDGDFSFLLTLASMISCCSFFMLALYQETTKSCVGISAKMMQCYLVLQVCRLCAIVPFEGYLPFDSTGDWLYQVIESVILILAAAVVYTCSYRFPHTYSKDQDTFNHFYLIVPAFILGGLLHPSLNDNIPSDICWAVALYLESVASLPQLFMFQREGQVHKWTAHFLAAQATSKIISFLFWASSFGELHNAQVAKNSANPLKGYVGYWVLIMQGFQLLVMGDFTYQYYKCLVTGVPINRMLSEV